MKTSRDLLRFRGIRQEIAGYLLDRELIKRHVVIQISDHPIPPRPTVAKVITREAMRVCVSSQIEPQSRLFLAKLRAMQEVRDHRQSLAFRTDVESHTTSALRR